MTSQSRSSTTKTEDSKATLPWVGGRHNATHAPRGGGGYLDNYTLDELKKAASIADLELLRSTGISPAWLKVAERIGFDAFVDTLYILRESSPCGEDLVFRVRVPTLTRFLHVLRSSHIIELRKQGLSYDEIITSLKCHPLFAQMRISKQILWNVADRWRKIEKRNNLRPRVDQASS